MSNFKSDLITKGEAALLAQSDGVRDGDDLAGVLLIATAIVTLAGTEAANDTIQLVDLPAGAVVVPQLSHVTGADPGTTLTLDIGDAGDTDRYADGIVLSAGGQVAFCSATLPAAVAAPYRLTGATRIYATVASAASLTAAVKLVVTIAYRVKG